MTYQSKIKSRYAISCGMLTIEQKPRKHCDRLGWRSLMYGNFGWCVIVFTKNPDCFRSLNKLLVCNLHTQEQSFPEFVLPKPIAAYIYIITIIDLRICATTRLFSVGCVADSARMGIFQQIGYGTITYECLFQITMNDSIGESYYQYQPIFFLYNAYQL